MIERRVIPRKRRKDDRYAPAKGYEFSSDFTGFWSLTRGDRINRPPQVRNSSKRPSLGHPRLDHTQDRRLPDRAAAPLPARGWNDPHALRRHIRKGDVLLVDGDNRDLGDHPVPDPELLVARRPLRRRRAAPARRRSGATAPARRFGDDAEDLLVEALPDGVVASPLSKYIDYNIRIVRPHRLRPEHLKLHRRGRARRDRLALRPAQRRSTWRATCCPCTSCRARCAAPRSTSAAACPPR